MGDGRKILDDLRDVLQDGVDEVERTGARHLDRLAKTGVDGLEQFRAEMAATAESDSPSERRRERRGPLSHAERKAEKAARKAYRAADRAAEKAAEKAERKLERLRSRKHRKRSRRGSRRDERDLTPEEREHRAAVRLARRRANQRLGFLTHAGTYAATLGIILVATRSIRVVMIVALGWGIGVFAHYLWSMAAPRLRDHWVEQEVGARSKQSVKAERRHVETRSRRSLEDLSASIAHEIRNPITAAKSLVQQMGEDPASNENLEYAGLALSELDRVERSISHLLRYARDEEPRFEPVALRSVALAAVEGLRDRATASGVELIVEFDRAGDMRGDPEKLRRVIENLIANAVDAISAAGVPLGRVELLGGENLAGSEVWLRVIDNGPGIPADERDRIWSPFFTTKETGTGLGLALSRKAVEAHGGRIELLSDPRQGSEFILTFPKDPAFAATDGATAEEGEPHVG